MSEDHQPLKNRARDRGQFRAFFDALPKKLPLKVDELGEPVSLHKTSKVIMIMGVCFGVFLIVTAVVVGVLIAGASEMRSTDATMLSIAVGLCGVIGVGMAVFCFLKIRTPNVVVVFEEGFVRASGKDVAVAPWAEIENVWESITELIYNGQQIMIFVYTVELPSGKKLVFNSQLDSEVQDIRKLGMSIQDGVTRFKLPRALDRFQKGKTIAFDSLQINKEGVRHGDNFLAWREIEETTVEDGNIVIRQSGKKRPSAQVATAEVPNVRLFLAIVDMIQSGAEIVTPSGTAEYSQSNEEDTPE